MIWQLRTPKTKKRCIACNKPIEEGSKVEVGFTPKWYVSKEVVQLVYDFMRPFEGTKHIMRDENTGKYYVSAEHDIIFCGDCLGRFCEEYFFSRRFGSKVEIIPLAYYST